MSERSDADLVADIREASRRITSYLGEMTYAAFLEDTKTQDSVVRNLEIVGEAARHVSDDLRARTPLLPWKSMAGIRDRLIHAYFGVDFDVVWKVAKDELPTAVALLDGKRGNDS